MSTSAMASSVNVFGSTVSTFGARVGDRGSLVRCCVEAVVVCKRRRG